MRARCRHGCYSVGNEHALGCQSASQGRRSQSHHAQEHPGGPPGRCPYLRHPGQPVRPQGQQDPPVGGQEQGRALLHADQRVLGQPHRGALRVAAAPRQLQPPQSRRPDPSPAPLPALAQPERSTSRRPGRPAPGTRPCPQRERHPLGPPSQLTCLSAAPLRRRNKPCQVLSGLRASRQACGLFTRPPGSCSSLAVTTSPACSSRPTMRSTGRRYDS